MNIRHNPLYKVWADRLGLYIDRIENAKQKEGRKEENLNQKYLLKN
jgi:hypothetical protein